MRIVKKFGGTSVGDIEKIKNVAKIVSDSIKKGEQIVVVISAMSGITDSIYQKCLSTSDDKKYTQEFDEAIATGEQISASLLAIALKNLGYNAISYNCYNLPIYGDGEDGDGFITEINSSKILENLENNVIPIITGFQAIKKHTKRLITLGRGGSDYSAVMVAASIHADFSYIYTDVSGVYTADPKIALKARRINELTYDEIIEMSESGAKVLQLKSVIAAQKYKIFLKVISTFDTSEGSTSISSNMLLDRKDKIITINCKNIDNFSIITIISFDKEKNLAINEVDMLMKSQNIEYKSIEQINNRKIMITAENSRKNEITNLLHDFFYQ